MRSGRDGVPWDELFTGIRNEGGSDSHCRITDARGERLDGSIVRVGRDQFDPLSERHRDESFGLGGVNAGRLDGAPAVIDDRDPPASKSAVASELVRRWSAVTPTGWEAYECWERAWTAPTPAEIRVTDAWDLAAGTGVEFHWQAPRRIKATRTDAGLRLTGERGVVDLEPPAGAAVRIEAVPMPASGATRATFGYDGTSGEATVTARLSLRD